MPTDLITDPVTKQQFYRISPTDTYKPITPESLQGTTPFNVQQTQPLVPLDVKNLPITGETTTPSGAKVDASTGKLISGPPVSGTDLLKDLNDLQATIGGRDLESDLAARTSSEQKELADIELQIKMHQADALANQKKAEESGETIGFASGEAARVAHNDAVEAIRLSALSQAKQGRLELASKLATKALNAKYQQEEKALQTQRNNIINNYEKMTDAQKKQADASLLKLNAQDTFVATNKKKETDLQTIGNTAAANGAPLSLINKALATKDTIQANAMLAKYVGTATGQVTPASTIAGETNKVFNDAIQGLKFNSVADRKDAAATVQRLVNEGDLEGAREQLVSYVYNSSGLDQQKVLDGKREAITALENIQTKLDQFESAGGKTGIFTGLSEKALQKVGATQSGELAGIANDIALAIIDYRRAASGAAFTKEETGAYEGVYPSIGKTKELNKAKIDSLINKYKSDREGFVERKVGTTKYKKIFRSEGKLSAGSKTVQSNGRTWTVGQPYKDGSGKVWVVDAQGKWTKQ